MKKLIIKPDGWPCTLAECPPGFFVFEGWLGFKSEYGDDSDKMEVFNSGGEAFWGGVSGHEARAALVVQPVVAEWEEHKE